MGKANRFRDAPTRSSGVALTDRAEDIPGIRSVVQSAFGRTGEADWVDALRRAGVLVLSAVATVDRRIIRENAIRQDGFEGEVRIVRFGRTR